MTVAHNNVLAGHFSELPAAEGTILVRLQALKAWKTQSLETLRELGNLLHGWSRWANNASIGHEQVVRKGETSSFIILGLH